MRKLFYSTLSFIVSLAILLTPFYPHQSLSQTESSSENYALKNLNTLNFGHIIPINKEQSIIEVNAKGQYALQGAVLANASHSPSPANYELSAKPGSLFDIYFPREILTQSGAILRNFHISPESPITTPMSGKITFSVGATLIIPQNISANDHQFNLDFSINPLPSAP